MNKAAANFLSSFIPVKLARKKWRLLLGYGLIRSVRTTIQMKKWRNISPIYYLTICARAKNEGEYFIEWIEWHKKMGVEKFYIYDNESTDNTFEILKPYIESGLVEYIFWPGKKQIQAPYTNCIETKRTEAQWIAFIDLDEFIVPIKDKNISEFLNRFEQYPSVEINWLIYGSGGAGKKEAGNVMQRFKHHAALNHPMNRFVKNIVNPRRVISADAHIAAAMFGCSVDSHGKPAKTYYRNREPLLDTIRINHYAVKSLEEYDIKRNRGRASTAKQYEENYLQRYDLNDVKEE